MSVATSTRALPRLGTALLRTARPRQWIKNLLVFAAPAAAGVLLRPHVAMATGGAFLAFTLAAIATYFVNDAVDVAADRRHPVKRWRPVAAGLVSPHAAKLAGFGAAVAALAVAGLLGWAFTAVVGGYLTLTAAYSTRLKRMPVVDVLAVAAGFLLRAAGGAVAAGVPLSNWFLLVALFGSLYLVTAKRLAEQKLSTVRPTVAEYPSAWLQQVMTMSLTGTVMAYALWAFQYIGDAALPVLALSLGPFLAALMRYGLLVARGDGEAPEKVVTSDRFLLVAGLIWAGLVAGGLYLG
jgi:decaprenyl-phosphate phosphoribosyltransferase